MTKTKMDALRMKTAEKTFAQSVYTCLEFEVDGKWLIILRIV